MRNLFTIVFVVFAASIMAACGTAEYDWNKALSINTVAAYQAFLQNHGGDNRAGDARGRMLALQDDQWWVETKKANTIDSFQAYLRKEPGGIHAGQAQFYIATLQRIAAWKAIPHDASAATLQTFLKQYPQGAESTDIQKRLDMLTAYRIELDTAQTKAEAEKKLTRIQMRYRTVLRGVTAIESDAPNTGYRILSEPMNQADATATCKTLEHTHQSCKIIANNRLKHEA